jgi:exopolyphosphatase/guanosine-5'-triphosphate,3'-diphosphate pyrophosphatase
MKDGTLLGAIDLGSNSFRLELAKVDHGQIERVQYLKETVRQGAGLDANRMLSTEALQRGWECLQRFAERLRGISSHQIRAVATQTLREARNRDEFIARGEAILGCPIDVISGKEEARLIYQGVSHLLPQSDETRLVIDIGGRSTEMIVGRGYQPLEMESYRVGSVSWSQQYFGKGGFTAAAFKVAVVAARASFEEATRTFDVSHWHRAYGSSGTIGAVAEILSVNGKRGDAIDYEGLQWLKDKLIRAEAVEKLKLDGLKEDRRAVLGGGLAVLIALFEALDIPTLWPAEGALRQGVLFDLLDHDYSKTDLRDNSVARLVKRFGVDASQVERVSRASQSFFRQLSLGEPSQSALTELQDQDLREVIWASHLHEIGMAISHSDYHKHGAYILDNADALGFSLPQLHRLGQLVLGHMGKLKKLEASLHASRFVAQLLVLRISVIVSHARVPIQLQDLRLKPTLSHGQLGYLLEGPGQWAKAYPQSAYLLEQETLAWDKVDVDFRVKWRD